MAENKRNLPYLAPLARVIPLVYDQSISYYEFLNKLYEAVDVMIDECEDIKAELPEIRANIARLADEIGNLSDLHTTRKDSLVSAVNDVLQTIGNLSSLQTINKSTVVGAINEVLQALSNESTTRAEQVDNLTNALNSTDTTVRKHSTEIQNMLIKYGSERDSSGALVANIEKNKELYVGPGTISEAQGDIPYLKESYDALRDNTEQEITELREKDQLLESAIDEIKAPFWGTSGIGAVVEYIPNTSQTVTITTTVGDVMNKSFLVLLNNSAATSSTNNMVTCRVQVGDTATNMNLAKLNAVATSAFISPDIQFEFFGSNGAGIICHHEFGAGTSNAGIYDGYKKVTASDVIPGNNTPVVISVTLPIIDSVEETSPVVYVKKIRNR